MNFCIWKACVIRFKELRGAPLWDLALCQSANSSLHGGWFIYVEAFSITFYTWKAFVIHFNELGDGLFLDLALHRSVHASLHGVCSSMRKLLP